METLPAGRAEAGQHLENRNVGYGDHTVVGRVLGLSASRFWLIGRPT
jgi:hypothetical protein